ncbi:MAG: hypothetical protein A2139_13145 [Desulfobacca sp. RBG_16_60_12]|nr:MAG: hypothetical protein A2139_13145 [Desulfobacca sp. RBG_16_60_12]
MLILLLALRSGPGLPEDARLSVAIVVTLLTMGIACRGDPICRGAVATGVIAPPSLGVLGVTRCGISGCGGAVATGVIAPPALVIASAVWGIATNAGVIALPGVTSSTPTAVVIATPRRVGMPTPALGAVAPPALVIASAAWGIATNAGVIALPSVTSSTPTAVVIATPRRVGMPTPALMVIATPACGGPVVMFQAINVPAGLVLHLVEPLPLPGRQATVSLHPLLGSLDATLFPFQISRFPWG